MLDKHNKLKYIGYVTNKEKIMLTKLNTPATALVFTILFVWLSITALHHVPQQGYTHSEFDVLPKSFKQKQAEALMKLWHIEESEIDQPIALFGKD